MYLLQFESFVSEKMTYTCFFEFGKYVVNGKIGGFLFWCKFALISMD